MIDEERKYLFAWECDFFEDSLYFRKGL